jgi:hypothetical protein
MLSTTLSGRIAEGRSCLPRVNRALQSLCRSLPVYPDKQTFQSRSACRKTGQQRSSRGVVPASGPTRNGRSTTFRESGTLSSTKAASTTSGRNQATSSCVSMNQRIRSRLPCADFCAQLRGAPRSNPAQHRHAKGETVSHPEFIALLHAKAPKLNRRAERCTTCEKDILMTREATSLPATSLQPDNLASADLLASSVNFAFMPPFGPAVCQCGSGTAGSS